MNMIILLTQLFLSILLTSTISSVLSNTNTDLDMLTDSILDRSLDEVFEKYSKLLPSETPNHKAKTKNSAFLQSSIQKPLEEQPLEIFSYEPFVWSHFNTSSNFSPKARKGHSAISVDTFMVIFGGCYFEDLCFNDVIFLDLNTHKYIKVKPTGEIPSPRGGHSANLYGEEMWVFGGADSSGYYSELYSLNLATVSISFICISFQLEYFL